MGAIPSYSSGFPAIRAGFALKERWFPILDTDVTVVGGGPGGLAVAETLARAGVSVVVLEQSREIGSPTRTSGGSFIREIAALGIPKDMYHPIRRGRFVSPNDAAVFEYREPAACVIDVRRVFQFLAERAAFAGARIQVNSQVTGPIIEDGRVIGVQVRDGRSKEVTLRSGIVVDASGYRSSVSKEAGLHHGFRRFGVGAEYDLYAPDYDQDEAVLIVGSRVAPAGYAWAFPWGAGRVRVGVGIIHADSRADPSEHVDRLVREADSFGLNLRGAQPIEYHFGLIPSEGLCERLVGDGILAVGDAAGQASALVGEGIRWAIKAGRMAGEVAADGIRIRDYSRRFLVRYEDRWRREHGANLRIAYEINKKIAAWTDDEWDKGVGLLKGFTADEFAEAMQANFMARWALWLMIRNPMLIRRGARELMARLLGRNSESGEGG